jgi:multidrug resistance protein
MPPPDQRHPVLGRVYFAGLVQENQANPRQTRHVILLLAGCVALMMTGFGIIMPVFARRLGEFGAGVQALGWMTTAFALAQLVAAPFLGSLADRIGRRPLVLLALAAFTLANIGYLLARTTGVFILVRALGGAFTAGLFPAAMGVVADLVPEEQRARWIGLIMGGYGAGFVFGPVIGGVLYDAWGFAAPFTASAAMALIALVAAIVLVPETRPASVRQRAKLRERRAAEITPRLRQVSLLDSMPRPLIIFASLLVIEFGGAFAFAYIEPQMVFYVYDQLAWSTAQFGLVVGVYGLAMVFGQAGLGQLSDRYGRKPIIVIGVLLNTCLYIGMATIESVPWMTLIAFISGLGSALMAPALSAYVMDISLDEHRARVMGIKEAALALGGVLGPLLVVVASSLITPRGIFLSAGLLTLLTAILGLVVLQSGHPGRETTKHTTWSVSQQRALAAQATLSGLVLSAYGARGEPNHLVLTKAHLSQTNVDLDESIQ